MQRSRRDQSPTCSRRQVLPALLQELFVMAGSLKGGWAGELASLGNLPEDQLARIRPIVNPQCEIFIDQDHVCSRPRNKKTQAALKLFSMEKENLVAFNLFDGQHTLGEIGRRLSQEMGWEETAGFNHARALFLALAARMVCLPQDPPSEKQETGKNDARK